MDGVRLEAITRGETITQALNRLMLSSAIVNKFLEYGVKYFTDVLEIIDQYLRNSGMMLLQIRKLKTNAKDASHAVQNDIRNHETWLEEDKAGMEGNDQASGEDDTVTTCKVNDIPNFYKCMI